MLTTDQKGAAAEVEIAAAAIKLGVGVYRPLVEGGRYDLILEVRSALLRVQCKWASWDSGAIVVRCYSSRRGPSQMIVRTYTEDEIAAYCPESDRCYLLPPALFCGRRNVYLRVEPSRNNQRARINWAEEFEFEARLRALAGP